MDELISNFNNDNHGFQINTPGVDLNDPLQIGLQRLTPALTEIIFVDQGINNYQSLIAEIDTQKKVVEINSNQDGIQQITDTISQYNNIEKIQILSFANPGNLQLGNSQLNLNNFNQYVDQLSIWKNHLTDNADLLFYGCNLAENEQGISLLQNIANITGADIAASTDKTGNAALGGNWVLEENIGTVETPSLLLNNYDSVFDTLISSTQSQTIRQGLQSLADWLDTLESFGSLAENIPIIDEKLGSLLDAGDLVRTQIFNPIKTYLDNNPNPTTNDLLALVQGLANVTGVNLSTLDNKLTYSLTYNPTVTKTVNLDLDQFGLDADDTSNFNIDAVFNFNFAFGVDLTAGLAPSEAFFIKVNDLIASADLGIDFAANTLNANLGFLGVGITGGTLDLNPQLDVTLNDPNSDGYLTINELQSTNLASLVNITPTGTLNGELDFTVSSNFLPISGSPKLTIVDNNIFDSTAPTVTTSDLQELLNFKTLTPSDFIGLVSQLGSGLEKLASSLNIEGGIPFIDTKIGEIVNLAQSIEAKVKGLYDAVLVGLSSYTGNVIDAQPTLSQSANFQIAINDNTPIDVVVAAGNYTNRTNLVTAINTALSNAGLNGIVTATLDSDRIIFATTVNNAEDKLAIKFAADSIGMSEIGFEPSLNTGSLLKFTNIQELIPLLENLLGSNPNFTYEASTNTLKFDLNFTRSIEEEAEFDFNEELDLGIGKLAISGGADGEIGGSVNFSLSLGIDLSPIGGGFTLQSSTLLSALPDPVTTVAGADIQIILSDSSVAPIQVDLSTATTIGDVIQLIENATSEVEVTIDTDRQALIIKDLSGGIDRPFAILAANNSTAGTKLGIIGIDFDQDSKIEGVPLHGDSISERLFIVENSGIDANVDLTASDINLAAAISILQVGIENGTANVNIGTSITLKDPSADGKITLQEIFDNPLSSLVNINTSTASGNIILPLVLSGLDDLGISLPANTAIELGFAASLSGITTSFNVPDVNLESIINSFTNFSTDDLINVLGKVIELLNTQELGIFNQKIPLIDTSINELLEFTKPFVDTINSIVGSIADLRTTLLNEVTANGTGIQSIIASPEFLSELAEHEHLQDELFHAIERIVDVINILPEDINGLTFKVPALLLSAINGLGTVIDEIETEVTGASVAFTNKLTALKGNFTDILKAVPSVQKATDFILEKILDAVDLDITNIFTTVTSIRDNLDTRINALIAEVGNPSNPSQQTVLDALETAWNKLDTAVGLESLSSLVEAFSATYDAIKNAETTFNTPAFKDKINDLLSSLTSFTEAFPVRLGLQFNSDLSLEFSLDIDLAKFVDLSYNLPLNFSLEDTNLGVLPIGFETSGELEIEFGGSVDLDFGVDLTPASLAEAIYILPTTQLALTAYANLPDLDAEITIGGVGGVEIENGYIRFTDSTDNSQPASLTIGLNDANTDGKILLSELATLSTYDLTADGKFEVNLPIKVLSSDIGAITATLPDINDFSNFDLSVPSADFFDDLFAGDLDLLTIIKGIEAFLTLLENSLQSEALSSLPIIGDGLDFTGSIIGQLNDTFVKPLGEIVEDLTLGDGAAAIKEAVQQKVFDTIGAGGLNLIILNQDFHDEGNDGIADITANWQDVEFIIDNDQDPDNAVNLLDTNIEILLNLNFGFQDTLSTDFDLGFDGLGLIGASIIGGVDITLDANFQVGFGVNKKQGAFIQLNDNSDPEIGFGLDVSLSNDFELKGNLFFLNVIATNQDSDKDGKYTGIAGGFGVDLVDDDGTLDNRVGLLNIGKIDVEPKFNASIEIDLLLEANVSDDANLPSIKADLLIDWALDDSKSLGDQSAPDFSLNNARLDLGQFISKAIGPILVEVDKYLEPIRPVLDILDTEIPVISQLSKLLGQGEVTFLDAIGALGEGGAEVAKVIRIFKEISDFVDAAAQLNGKNIEISLGSLADIGTDIRNAATIDVDTDKISGVIKQGIDGVKNALSQLGTADATAANNFFTSSVGTADSGLGLAFPIFTDPSNIFKLLLGQTADLITWDIPAFTASFSFSQLFGPIIPPIPLFAKISGQLEVFADFFVGLDTRGLKTGNFLDGFYFGDEVDGVDVPELGLTAEFAAGAELNVVVASAGVRGGIRAGIFADWNDPNSDGKLYLDELISNAQRGIECIFDLEGALKAFFEAYVKIGLDTPFGFVTLFSKSFELASVTLLDFSHSCPPLSPPVLAQVEGGTLILHTGENAGKRQPGYSTDGDETLQLRQLNPGEIEVKGFGETQVYTGVNSIFWDGGAGNDVINIDASVTVNTTLRGGDGDDEIKGGSGVDDIDGGAGRDQITGGAASDIIHGGVGNDLIFGNAGADQLFGDDGDDNIYGGDNDGVNANDGDDTIAGGKGNDKLVGNLGNDKIKGEDGNDNITGNEGNDILEGGAETDLIEGGAGDDSIYGGAGNDILLGEGDNVKAGTGGNDKIWGGGGNDDIKTLEGNNQIYGDGEDSAGVATTTANEGDDTIVTGNGVDTIYGGGKNDIISAGGGNDYIEGGADKDTINAGDGDDKVIGGSSTALATDADGDDLIYGEGGNDTITGDNAKFGSVILIGGAGNDSIYGGDGNDNLYGQAGNDLIEGGTGADNILGGTENDILRGQEGNDYIEGGADNDEISGGAGDDAIIGGVADITTLNGKLDGIDTIIGDIGNDVILGDNGVISLTGNIVTAATTNANGGSGADNIFGGVGNDIIFGGGQGDNLVGDAAIGTGDDIIIGDQGYLNATEIASQFSSVAGSSGNDTISGSGGKDIVLGGDGNDNITGDSGADILLGDYGTLSLNSGIVTRITSTVPDKGGNDIITGGNDDDIVIGGIGDDTIIGGDDNGADILLGDNGTVVRNDGSVDAHDIFSQSPEFGGVDTITGGAGDDIIIGGSVGDSIQGNTGKDILLGDHGRIQRNAADVVERITTILENNGGNDTISGNEDADIALGGIGDDTITGGDDVADDILLGDNGTVVRNDGSVDANDIFSQSPEFGGVDTITGGAGDDIIIGGSLGDNIQGNTGKDILLGDHGRIQRNAADVVERITTILENNGGNDTISGNEDADIALGGIGDDTITGGDDVADDILLGDNGTVVRNDGSVDANDIFSQSPEFGGVDTITGGAGDDIIIGGSLGDNIQGNTGKDILLGDHGRIQRNTADVVERITTILENNGGNDTISGNEDADIALGGIGDDTITGGDDVADDILLGDNGTVVRNDGSVDANDIFSQSPEFGGVDTITGGAGNDIILGGSVGDQLFGNAGNDVVIGDNAYIKRNNADTIEEIKTTFPDKGGDDTITGNDGNDILIGGFAKDSIDGAAGNDIALGDNGLLDYKLDANLNTLDFVTTTNPTLGGEDNISSGDGNDLIFGGTLGDNITAGAGNDLVFGDHGKAEGNIDLTALPLNQVNPPFTFTAIDTQQADLGGDETIAGGSGDDIILGQQGSDRLFGNEGDDDLIGGHNVAGGKDGNDEIDGGTGNDVIAGDNASVLRRADTLSPRIRVLSGTVIYDSNGNPQVTANGQLNPTGTAERNIQLFDHSINAAVGTFGNDVIAGGANNDLIFGQLGNDVIQGDSSTAETVSATDFSITAASDGDDYIEGGGGDDLIFGNLGQDDIIGGSSSLFGNTTASQRPDGKDIIFGGAGTSINRNDVGDTSAQGHARDADVIIGDNGNIFRLVGTNGVSKGQFLTFTYDNYGSFKIIPRAVELLYYTLGGNSADLGNDDLIRGEAGDDVIHGMTGNDVIFGDGQDDDIYGGVGSDRLYGGTGEDGILGDDGKIYTSRNGLTETLNGITQINAQTNISLPGPFTGAWIYISDRLNKTVDLAAWEKGGNDIIYGGLGDDFLHGGAGDDGISGAEAQAAFYNSNPVTNTNPLNYDPVTRKLAAYDANNPMQQINGFFLNFDAVENGNNKINDGKDRIFGDIGNDWLVGGTQNDRLFGGMGDDVINADDNHDTNGGLNNRPDIPKFADADFAFGGGGLDVLIANTGGDRLFDWIGEFNSYFVPFSPFGDPTVVRSSSPQIQQFLLGLGKESGADQTRTEPNGELGLVSQKDPQWQDQSGSPRDPQAGNTQARRDTQGSPEDDRKTANK